MARVWVNGTFDILHRGHIELLKFASTYGTVRVGIDTDDRVRRLKCESRPINSLEDRIMMMSSLKFVHSVVSFDSDLELEREIQYWNPFYMIIGSDYRDKKIIGSQYVNNIILFDIIDGYSTTKKINQINGIS